MYVQVAQILHYYLSCWQFNLQPHQIIFCCFVLHKTAREVGYVSSAVCTNADCSLHKEGECLVFLNLSKLLLMLHICQHIKHKISKYVLTHTVQKYLLSIKFSLDRFIWSIQLLSVKLKSSKVSIPSQPCCQSKVRSLSRAL